MIWRMQEQTKNSLTGRILLEIFKRLGEQKTAFGRMKLAHTREKTKWW
jgi:hypothetical protein